ncbi:MAG: Smr/MutS family protein [Methylovirgula sp.]
MSFVKDTRLRRLSADEVELWLAAMRDVAPRQGVPRTESSLDTLKQLENATKSKAPARPPGAASVPRRLPGLAPLDRRARHKLARGAIPVDAAIDLHGMRQQEAHHALLGFLSRAQRDGAKIVLVVTGKGEGRPADGIETGVLRRAVPLWLNAPEWRYLIVGFEEATRTHGGAGALYVRLRRHERRKG